MRHPLLKLDYGPLWERGIVHGPLAIPVGLMVVGTLVSAYGAEKQGQAQQSAYNFGAASARQAAGEQSAAGSANALAENRKTQLELSANAAAAAGSGVNPGFGSPLTNTGQIAKYGTYNQLMAMYDSQTQATALENQARGLNFAGANAAQAGKWGATESLIGGANTLYGKYGGGAASPSGPGGAYLAPGADINPAGGLMGGGYAGGYG